MINPYKYTCYRTFLRDFLKANSLGYKSFSDKYKSLPHGSIAKILQRKIDQQFAKNYNVSGERLALLLKEMGLKNTEIEYLLMLRLENDALSMPAKDGNIYQKSIKSILKKLLKINNSTIVTNKNDSFSRLLESLPEEGVKKVIRTLELEVEKAYGRQRLRAPRAFIQEELMKVREQLDCST